MGDRSGNIRWWDVTTGHSSSFNTHREGIRRIKFSPVVAGDRSRGRVAVLFYDNTFAVYDLVSVADASSVKKISSLSVLLFSFPLKAFQCKNALWLILLLNKGCVVSNLSSVSTYFKVPTYITFLNCRPNHLY